MDNITYHSHVRSDLLSFIPKISGNILDVGCGSGATINYLRQKIKNVNVFGVDICDSSVDIAINNGLNVLKQDVSFGDFSHGSTLFDCIIFADVLEHVFDPELVLSSAKSRLNDNGVVLISVPNVKNYQVMIDLLFKDKWTYVDAGILDRTHLRFFTFSEALKLIDKCGFFVEEVKYVKRRNSFFKFISLFSRKLAMSFWSEQFLFKVKAKK